jgi:hypothetical protein
VFYKTSVPTDRRASAGKISSATSTVIGCLTSVSLVDAAQRTEKKFLGTGPRVTTRSTSCRTGDGSARDLSHETHIRSSNPLS